MFGLILISVPYVADIAPYCNNHVRVTTLFFQWERPTMSGFKQTLVLWVKVGCMAFSLDPDIHPSWDFLALLAMSRCSDRLVLTLMGWMEYIKCLSSAV